MEATSPLLANKKKEMRVVRFLPEEIMMEILLRLPPESLIRFKCVCKSWYALFSDPSFADKHLHFNNNRTSSTVSLVLSWICHTLKLKCNNDLCSLVSVSDNDDDDQDKSDRIPCVVEDLNLSIIPQNLTIGGYLLGVSHCNGILCLSPISLDHDKIVLYNPTIREFKILSKPRNNRACFLIGEGFGYNSKANDYNIVRILANFCPYNYIAKVYSLASDSWRDIQINIESIDSYYRRGVCCKGVFYWLVSIPDRVLSFDMSNDEFHIIPLPVPGGVEQLATHLKILAKWNESVALFISEWVSLAIEIWVMDHYHSGSEASWTKHVTIGPLVSFYTPVMFWKSDELLMVTEDGGTVSYNLNTQKFRNLPIHGVSLSNFTGDFFVKSLVSVNGGN